MFLAILFLMTLIILYLWKDARKPINFPPGPSWIPFATILLLKRLHKIFGFHHLVWHHLCKKFGSIVGLRIGKDRLIIVSGRDAIREFYNLPEFNGRPDGFFYRIRSFDKRLGIVFVDGTFWEIQRKFSSKILRQFGMGKSTMITHIEREAMEMVNYFKKKIECAHGVIDMEHIFDVPVLNVLWAMLAGHRFNLDDERLPQILKMIHESFRVIDMSGGVVNQFPFIRLLAPDLSGYRPLVNTLKPLWRFIKETIVEVKRNLQPCDEPSSFIEAFLLEIKKTELFTNNSFTEEQLSAICLDLFQAGTETTSNTLSFGIIYMLHNEHVQINVRKELDTVVGRDRLPTLADRNKLPYTEAVIAEIQRISNVAPVGIAHRCMDTVKFHGYVIPKNTIALISLYGLHMDEKYWKDPLKFRPERFLDEFGNFIHHEYFIPFGLGKRRCMGENLAKSSLFLFFASFLHGFYMKMPNGEKLPDTTGFDGITLSPKGYKILLSPRHKDSNLI